MTKRYYYRKNADGYTFIRIPKLLVTDELFSSVTIQAKILYGLLLDRMGLSVKYKWIDEKNRVYVIYPLREIQEDLGISRKKA
ncbi:MAG: replication initiator protein A [Eubacterium sp.]|nr:replication initiator protein A [Eubacterium sp.]